jgi:hypothetical protein
MTPSSDRTGRAIDLVALGRDLTSLFDEAEK